MDNQVKSVSWIGNICEKFETLYSEIDSIIKQDLQHAENQLLAAGENVKQFCSEFMDEILPTNIINTLQEKNSPSENEKSVDGGVLDKEVDAGHTIELSHCDSFTPLISMETVEEAHATLTFTLKDNNGKEMSFEENCVEETKYATDILKFKGNNNGKFHDVDKLPNPVQVDRQSSYSPEAGETSVLDPRDGEARISTAQDLAACIVCDGSNDCQLLQKVSSCHTSSKELLDDGPNGCKAAKDEDIGLVGFICKLPKKVKIADNGEHCLTADCPDQQHPVHQRTVCQSWLTVKLEKECECEKAAGSKDCNPGSDQPEGEFLAQTLLTEDLDLVDQDFCESDWVIV